jgi:uncharacterized protein
LASPFRVSATGVTLIVRLTPSGGADRIDGLATDDGGRTYLKVRVRAAPEDGLANAALEALIAKALKLPKSAVKVTRGGKSRLKTIEVSGDSEELLARAAALLDGLAAD